MSLNHKVADFWRLQAEHYRRLERLAAMRIVDLRIRLDEEREKNAPPLLYPSADEGGKR